MDRERNPTQRTIGRAAVSGHRPPGVPGHAAAPAECPAAGVMA
jgi:hypothetical protein